MNKFFTILIILALAAGGFYLYTQSGEVLDEQAPVISENTSTPETTPDPNKPLLQGAKINRMIPDEPENDPTLTKEKQENFVSRQGMFNEVDLIHKGSGLALIYPETSEGPILRLENFSVTRGPNLYVYLSRNGNISSSDQLGTYHDLGPLKSSKGNQNYKLPSNHSEFKSVVIWCKAFGVLFSSATLLP
ncbi:MAG: DM13 domain-containing protein [bacterium]|nr:DM13 domain-containing protein [bacterium]